MPKLSVLKYAIAVFVLFSLAFLANRFIFKNHLTKSKANSDTVATKNDATMIEKEKLKQAFGNIPLYFEPNLGQTDERVKFMARGHGYSLFLTDKEAVLSLQKHGKNKSEDKTSVIKMSVEGANETPKTTGMEETESKSNYFIGNDPKKWRINIPNFQKVKYEKVYSGVDVVYYGKGQQLEYDFLIQPNADPNQIKLKFNGIRDAKIEEATGDLLLETEIGIIRQHKPIVYQTVNGERKEIASSYSVSSPKSQVSSQKDDDFFVSFNLAEYDKSKELVIDPVLVYGSYLGGNLFDEGRAIAVDAQGNAYVVGTAASRNFPTTQGTIKPVMLPTTSGNQFWYDAFVTKVNPTGTALVFSTYYGGRNGNESGGSVAVDSEGNVLISGTTMSSDFPTVNAYQTTFGGTDDGFAAKLNSTGSAIIYSTYLGGNNTDLGGSIALNKTTGDAVFVGYASSPNFSTTPGAYKEKLCTGGQSCNGIFYSGSYLVKLTANGNAVYSTLFDAGINDVTLDANDNATFGGTANSNFPATAGAFQTASSGGIEGFIAKINPAGNALVYGTFLGGGLQSDRVKGIALDSVGNIYITGQTENTGFPTTEGAFDRTLNGGEDGFVTKLNASGSALVYSTFLGGAAKDQPFSIGIGENDNVFVAGETFSGATFPLKKSINGTNGSIFLTRFNADASGLVFSTFLGVGGAYDLAVDSTSNAYITGHTTSVLVTPDSFQPVKGDPTNTSVKDGFVLKIGPTDENAQTYSISGNVTDPTQFGNSQPIVVTITGTVNRSYTLPYGSGSGVIPYFFGDLPAEGNYVVTAKKVGFETDPPSVAFNNLGANQFADFTILQNQKPVGVITSPQHGANYNAPATITIQATASDPDGDAIQKVDFYAYSSEAGNVYLGTDTTVPYEFTWTNVSIGTWSLSAIPTDSHGLSGVSTPVVHVFVVDPTVLSVQFISPIEGQTFVEGDYVPIRMNVSSSVRLVEVRNQNNNIVAWLTGSPWSSQWRVMNVGNYTLTATASNSQGQTVTAEPIHIVVNPINHRITGKIIDSVTSNPVSNVTLNLVSPSNPNITATTTTDSNGNYLFTNLGTTPNDGVTITPSLSGYGFDPQTRNIGFLGYIKDWTNQNFTAVHQTGISVNITSPTNGQTYNVPAFFNIFASATSNDGLITKVEFYQVSPNGTTTLLSTDTDAPYFSNVNNPPVGNYAYFARATDSTNAVAESARVNVSIVNPTPTTVRLQGAITNPFGGTMQGIAVVLTGTANGNSVNQTSVSNFFGSYGFFNLPAGGNYTITPQPTGTMTFTPPSVLFTNVTSDNLDVDFVSSAANQAPTVQLNSPTEGAVFNMPVTIPISATAADGDGQIARLRVSAEGNSMVTTIGEVLGGTINLNWQPNLPGSYKIWVDALDNGGLHTTTFVNITVNPPSPVSISGRIVDRNSIGIEGVTVELRDFANEQTVITTTMTNADGRYTIANIQTFRSYTLKASKLNYTFSPQKRSYFNLSTTQTGADYTGTVQLQNSDFDGDSESDVAVWRPSTGVWYVKRSTNNSYTALQFGGASFGDVLAPGNYDGDQKMDYAVYRKGIWYVLNSSNGQTRIVQYGVATDKPVPGDYDGDGKTDIAVWRPSTGVWYISQSSNGNNDIRQFGLDGDIPLAGDYDGDGKTDLTIWRPSTGIWYVWQSSDGGFRAFQFGLNGDIPLVGDFDADKTTDITVWRPSTGVWYSYLSSDGSYKIFQWGISTDMPTPGDYDRDGKTDFAVYRKSEGNWYIFKSSNSSFTVERFGLDGDMPVPSAYIN